MRIVVIHDDEELATYEVKEVRFNEPVHVSSEVGGVVTVKPLPDARPCECLDGGHLSEDGLCMCGGKITNR